mgnify:CR=1 FL=1
MLETIKNAFKTKEIRNKLLFVFFGLIIVRIGCNIPLPGVNTNVIQNLFDNNQALNFLDVMTGGSFTRMSIFALNITPYITASIIVQLLTIAIPRLEELQKDGEDGRKKINEYTRYLSIVLALIEGLAIVIGFRNQGFFTESGYTSVIISVVALTAGAAFLMWLGEEITEKGIGNGISMVIMAGIVGRMPQQFSSAWSSLITGESAPTYGAWLFATYILVYLLIIIFVTLINTAERRIPIQYTSSSISLSKPSEANYLPLKVNSASVIPVIFASSLMMAPIQIASFFPSNDFIKEMQKWLGLQTWYSLVIYVLLILFFTFFYTKMQINPEKVAENLGKSGSYIPSVRPGNETKEYINRVLSRITVLGSVALAIIAVMPHIMPLVWPDFPNSMALGGTGMIIVVGVAIETVRQVQGLITQKSYKKYYED